MNQTIAQRLAAKAAASNMASPYTVGLDLGDRRSQYCIFDNHGRIVVEGKVDTTRPGMRELASIPAGRIVMEVGTHSPWVSRQMQENGHEVFVANRRKCELKGNRNDKDDKRDARGLGRMGRFDPELLYPVRHRNAEVQQDRLKIHARAELLEARTKLINAARGMVKALGERLGQCDADQVGEELAAHLPGRIGEGIRGLLRMVAALTGEIRQYDQQLEKLEKESYGEQTKWMRQIKGVGLVVSMTYVLTLENPEHFDRGRVVGSYVGLRPKRRDSGETKTEMSITKEGDRYLRAMLVQSAQYIMSRRGEDSDLRRWGLKLAQRGGKAAKRKAVVAVARKLAVLLHKLWKNREVYVPLYTAWRQAAAAECALA